MKTSHNHALYMITDIPWEFAIKNHITIVCVEKTNNISLTLKYMYLSAKLLHKRNKTQT